jgi:hypothetical protein
MYIYDRQLSDSQARGNFGRGTLDGAWVHGLGEAPSPLPPKFSLETLKFEDGSFSNRLQSAFEGALRASLNTAAFSHLPDVRTVPIAIIGLDGGVPHPVAGQRMFEMFYSGSLLKTAAMYAAFQLRQTVNDLAATLDATVIDTPAKLFQKIKSTFNTQIETSVPLIQFAKGITTEMRVPKYPEIFKVAKVAGIWKLEFSDTGPKPFATHLHDMIVGSHNESAGVCIRALGYSWINGLLQSAGFLNLGIKGSEGIWLAGDYENQPTVLLPSVNDNGVKQATTCIHMAWLFSLLHDKVLVRNTVDPATGLSGNDEMLRLLRLAVDALNPTLYKNAPHSFDVLQSKIGIGQLKQGSCKRANSDRCVYSEAAILRHPRSGRKFVVVWQDLTHLRAHPTWWGDGLKRIVALIQKTMDDYTP